MFFVKVREKGNRAFWFLTSTGFTRLRIHASRFADKETAQRIVREIADNNPHVEAKAVAV